MSRAAISAELSVAQALAQAGNYRGALDRLRALNASGGFGDPRVLIFCAIYERALGQYKDAHRAVRAALAEDPNNALAHRVMGLVQLDLQSPDGARKSLDEAIRLEPDEAYHYMALARLTDHLDRHNETEAALRRALALAPDAADIRAALGRHLAGRRRFAEAQPLLLQALEATPNDPYILAAAGHAALAEHRDEDARTFAMAALAQDGANTGALDLLVQLKAKKGWFMRVWWRWAMMMSRMSPGMRLLLVFGLLGLSQVFFRVGRGMLPGPVLLGFLLLWIGFVVLTWAGPYIYQRMLKREMQAVRLRDDF